MPRSKHIHERILDNGLELVMYENVRAPIVTFQVWYKVGSGYESGYQIGMSHFLEHMMFLGSKNKSMDGLFKKISEYGGMQNAFTSLDYTAYYETVNRGELVNCVRYEADRMHNLLFDKRAFNREKNIILEERRSTVENSPYSRSMEVFSAIAHLSSPYSHPILGSMENINSIELSGLQAWYKHWYVPNNAIVVVAGDIDTKKTQQLVSKYFGPINAKTSPVRPVLERATLPLGKRTVELSMPAGLPWIAIGFNVPVLNTAELKWEVYALSLIGGILAGSSSSRLGIALLNKKQLAIGVTYHYSLFSRLDNILYFTINPLTSSAIEKVQAIFSAEIDRLQDKLVSASELQRVRVQLIASRIYENDSITQQAFEIGSFLAVGLRPHDIDNAIKQINAITPHQLREVARKYLIMDKSITTILHPA